MTFFERDDVTLYNSSALERDLLPSECLDLVVTSPPYNLGISYNSSTDNFSYEDYLSFSKVWLKNCYFWLSNTGRACFNIPLDKNKGGQQSVGADFTEIAKSVGFSYHSTIIWNEGNISRRTAWGSWCSASAPYAIAPVELILVMYKNEWKKDHSGESDITREEFMEWTNGVWTFSGESKKRIGHPAPFPRELPRRCIKLFSYKGEVVADPFSGSGTTMIESHLNSRKFIGIELDAGYCELSKKRFIEVVEKEGGLFT